MRIEGLKREWDVSGEEALEAVLASRDSRGGAEFWLSHGDRKFPCLAMQIGGTLAHVIFFPEDGHPGFRCLGGKGIPEGGFTKLVFDGSDPTDGEEVPNEFIITLSTALDVAKAFYHTGVMSDVEAWFEL